MNKTALLACVGLVAGAALAAPLLNPQPLSWAPPELTDPVVKSIGPSRSSLKLDQAKDYIIKLPENEPYIGELNIYGGHNVVLIGGTVKIPTDEEGYADSKRGLYVHGQTGTIHIEGLLITGNGLKEGVNIDERESGCIVQLQNVRVENVAGSYSSNHADIIQSWAGPSVLRIDRFTGYTGYQGFFLLYDQFISGFVPDEFTFKDVNLVGDGNAAYLLWLPESHAFPISLSNVWARPRSGNAGNRNQFLWPKNDPVWNPVQEGVPSEGDFVPVGVAGFGYVSPGYVQAVPPVVIPDPEPTDVPVGAYLWVGTRSRDFEDNCNWLVRTDEGFVRPETPPANEYGKDDVYFAGDASQCPNMPLLTATNHIVHQVRFLTSGWTIDAAHVDPLDEASAFCKLQVAKGYGGWGGNGVYKGKGDEVGLVVEAGAVGGTNTITAPLYQPAGLKVSVPEGTTLRLSGKVEITDAGTGLGSASKRMGFQGGGVLILDGDVANSGMSRCFTMSEGLLVLAKSAVAAISGGSANFAGGKVEMLDKSQVGGKMFVSGDMTIDFGGFDFNNGNDLIFGAEYDKTGTGIAWTGSIANTGNVQFNKGSSLIVNPTATQVVFDGGLKGPRNWHGSDQWFKVADNPSLDEELVFDGPLFNNESNHKDYGSRVHLLGWTCDGVASCGAVSFNAGTQWSGAYSKLFVETTVYDNASDGLGGLGAPAEVTVSAANGVLGGHGLLRTRTADVPVTVYGAIAPGSPAQRSGTLTVGEAEANVTTAFRTNSVLCIRADADGACPKLRQYGAVSLQAIGADESDAAVALPRVRVTGPVAPRPGRHEILRVTGTLDGAFDETVDVALDPGVRAGRMSLVKRSVGTDTIVFLRVENGFCLFVR